MTGRRRQTVSVADALVGNTKGVGNRALVRGTVGGVAERRGERKVARSGQPRVETAAATAEAAVFRWSPAVWRKGERGREKGI